MALTQRLNEKRSQLKETRLERGLDRASHQKDELQHDKDDLKHENRILRDEVDRGQDERDRLLDLVGKMERALEKNGKKKHTGRRLAFLGIGGLAAWAFGTQSGREQVNRAKARVMNDPRFQEMQQNASGAVNDAMSKGADAMNKGADAMNKGADAVNKGAGTLDKGLES
jgi:hypothetical protein